MSDAHHEKEKEQTDENYGSRRWAKKWVVGDLQKS